MTQEDKELLLKDLCARIPYGVICSDSRHGDSRITEINIMDETVYCIDFDEYSEINYTKPYLRPMLSMTDEEFKELSEIDNKRIIFSARHLTWHIDGEVIDFFNRKMLDWRGLISMGLALEAHEGMYK